MESGHEFEPGIEIGTDTSYRPTKPGHTTASLDAMSLHSICHSAYCALVSQDVFGELSVEINQNHEEKVASKDFLCFLFGYPNGAINPRNHFDFRSIPEVAEKQEDLGKFLRSCSSNEMYP